MGDRTAGDLPGAVLLVIEIVIADYNSQPHRDAILNLMIHYASDPAIAGTGLPQEVRDRLLDGLASRSDAVSVIAMDGDDGVGLINCFEGYSTFAAKPVLNLHDVTVLPTHRGRGIARQMIRAVIEIARQRGCAKLTLEVYQGNHGAFGLYIDEGFKNTAGRPDLGETLFLSRSILA